MSRYRSSDRKVYVGDLGKNIGSAASRQELEDSFSYYGPIRDVWVARNPPGFAFVEYEDARDAEDAVRGLDGRTVCGRRVRVEMSNGKGGRGGGHQRGRAFHPDDRCYECGECGHYARDCNRRGRGARRRSYSRGRRSASRSRSRDRGRSRSRNRSRSKDRSKSRDRGRSRSRSVDNRSKSRSRSKSRARDSADKNGTSRDNANHRPSVSPKTGP